MRKLAFVLLGLLAACAAPQWSKPGATAQNLADDTARCQASALEMLPMKPQMVSAGWETPPRRECSGQNCVNVPGTPAPPRMVDVNEVPRARGVDACLKALGWSR
jgi:hypothetical protein